MWVFTHDGFFSAVNKDGGPNDFMVRARFKGDLERLCAKMGWKKKIHRTLDADYAYRAVITRDEWQAYLDRYVQELSYPNFKGTMEDDIRHDIYMRVWSTLRHYQEEALTLVRKATKRFDPYARPRF